MNKPKLWCGFFVSVEGLMEVIYYVAVRKLVPDISMGPLLDCLSVRKKRFLYSLFQSVMSKDKNIYDPVYDRRTNISFGPT